MATPALKPTEVSHNPASQTLDGKLISPTYLVGPAPFSEPEIKAVADYISAQGNIKGYADIHSYSQLWMSVRFSHLQKQDQL